MTDFSFVRYILAGSALCVAACASALDLRFTNQANQPVAVTPEANTGLDAVYVVENTAGARVTVESTSAVEWYRFSNLGGGYAEKVPVTFRDGNIYGISADGGDCGYIIETAGRRYCFWVFNYAVHRLEVHNLTVNAEASDCQRTCIDANAVDAPLTFYTVNGRAVELSRDIALSYNTLRYDEEQSQWVQGLTTKTLSHLSKSNYTDAPLCDTRFTVTGDRFLTAWGKGITAETDTYRTQAVDARTSATQEARDNANEIKTESDGLGGSAPCIITFAAQPTDAAVFREWQMSETEDFDNPTDRFTQDEFTYTFNEQGTTYVRYVCGDADGVCFYEGNVYTISIGASKLLCPNVFSPGNQDGVNDEWRVSYSSLTSFQCDIFNRWGTRMTSFTNPAAGWDGKYNGKIVPSGVYFYVIKAKGADGVNYNLSGDINVLNSRKAPQGTTE